MYLLHLLLFLLCVYESKQYQLHNPKKFNTTWNAEESHKRVAQLMRSYYEEATSRITYLNPIRFMYEESPYYEMGYIMGEIIERYRKVVEHTQRPIKFVHMTLFDIIKRVEIVQKLYFELYHLVRMMHEIPRKWINVLEFHNIEKLAGPNVVEGLSLGRAKDKHADLSLAELFNVAATIREQERLRDRERRRRKKEFDKIRQAYLLGLSKSMKGKGKEYNKWWPIDYGWEIDYKW